MRKSTAILFHLGGFFFIGAAISLSIAAIIDGCFPFASWIDSDSIILSRWCWRIGAFASLMSLASITTAFTHWEHVTSKQRRVRIMVHPDLPEESPASSQSSGIAVLLIIAAIFVLFFLMKALSGYAQPSYGIC